MEKHRWYRECMAEIDHIAVPGAEEHPCLALVNTVGAPGAGPGEELTTPEGVRAWLFARGLIDADAELHDYCRDRIVGLRENLRDLLAASTGGGTPTPDAVQAVNRALTSAPGAMLLRFEPASGFSRSSDHPVTQVIEHVMALIAEDAATLLTGDDASKLAPCQADGCGRFFLRTHGRRQWCSTRCGDRVRAARAYARKRAQRDEPAA